MRLYAPYTIHVMPIGAFPPLRLHLCVGCNISSPHRRTPCKLGKVPLVLPLRHHTYQKHRLWRLKDFFTNTSNIRCLSAVRPPLAPPLVGGLILRPPKSAFTDENLQHLQDMFHTQVDEQFHTNGRHCLRLTNQSCNVANYANVPKTNLVQAYTR